MLNNTQRAQLAIWYEVNASLSAYGKLIKAFFNTENAWQATKDDWQEIGLHSKHLQRHEKRAETQAFLDTVNTAIEKGQYQLIFADEISFPKQLMQLFDPPPLLFVRGNISHLQKAQVAIVGSRKPTSHAQKITFDMAQYIAGAGYIVTSGLAQGVDYQAHIGALSQTDDIAKGRTLGVMGTGIDVCYPRHHSTLFSQIIDEGGCLISELLPHTPANKHTFPRRNRIVAGLALGTIVTEATINSGSLITARLTSEQGKQVFAVPSHIDNKNAEGCHHLIREGGTLIYHPEQVLEDLKFQQVQPILLDSVESNAENNAYNSAHNNANSNTKNSTKKTTEPSNIFDDSTDTEKADYQNQPLPSLDKDLRSELQTAVPPMPLVNTPVPKHLDKLFAQIDWKGVDVDSLVHNLQIPTHILLGQLMELELLGLIMEQGGRYVRV